MARRSRRRRFRQVRRYLIIAGLAIIIVLLILGLCSPERYRLRARRLSLGPARGSRSRTWDEATWTLV